MNPLLLLGAGSVSAVLLVGAAVALLRVSERDRRLAARVEAARGMGTPSGASAGKPAAEARARGGAGALAGVQRAVAGLGRAIMRSGLLRGRTRAELEQSLSTSGFRGPNALAVFVGSKLVLLASTPALAWLLVRQMEAQPMTRVLALAGGAVLGLVAPDMIVRRLRGRYLRRLEAGLPDALDMLVICAQAGLSLTPAMARVAAELRGVRPEVARELEQTVRELEIMSDAAAALADLGRRTGLDSLKRLTTTLVQTMQYGTPLTEALRGLSAEMRQETLTRFEERAARLPVLLTLPMILFILPCVFIIVGGPAAIQVMKALAK